MQASQGLVFTPAGGPKKVFRGNWNVASGGGFQRDSMLCTIGFNRVHAVLKVLYKELGILFWAVSLKPHSKARAALGEFVGDHMANLPLLLPINQNPWWQ